MRRHLILLPFLLAACGGSPGPGDPSAAPEKSDPLDWEPGTPELVAGREVYLNTCHLCHDEGEESAPRLSSEKAWEPRIAKGEETLIAHAIEGFEGSRGEMPARGGNKELTDPQVASAVRFMIAVPK